MRPTKRLIQRQSNIFFACSTLLISLFAAIYQSLDLFEAEIKAQNLKAAEYVRLIKSHLDSGHSVASLKQHIDSHVAIKIRDKQLLFSDHTSIIIANSDGKIIYTTVPLWLNQSISSQTLLVPQLSNVQFRKLVSCFESRQCTQAELDAHNKLGKFITFSQEIVPSQMSRKDQDISDKYVLAYTYSMADFYDGLPAEFFLEFATAVVVLFFAYLPVYLFFNYKICPSVFKGLQTDGLTQLMDRKLFVEICKLKLLRAQEAAEHYCLCILDIDDFKRINDTYGHGVGDVVISEVGALIKSNTRDYFDCSSRYGGEEFAILYKASAKDAVNLLNRLRHQIEMYEFNKTDQPVRITISSGFASTSKSGYSLELLMRRADELLYKSKFKGKNKVTADFL